MIRSIYAFLLGCLILLLTVSCGPEICPANGKEYQRRQLVKINHSRKRDKGLFPKSMHHKHRKYKKVEPKVPEEEEL